MAVAYRNAAALKALLASRNVVATMFGDSIGEWQSTGLWPFFGYRLRAKGLIPELMHLLTPGADLTTYAGSKTQYNVNSARTSAFPIRKGYRALLHSFAANASGTVSISGDVPGAVGTSSDWATGIKARAIYSRSAANAIVDSTLVFERTGGGGFPLQYAYSTESMNGGTEEFWVKEYTLPDHSPSNTGATAISLYHDATANDETGKSQLFLGRSLYRPSGTGFWQWDSVSWGGAFLFHHGSDYHAVNNPSGYERDAVNDFRDAGLPTVTNPYRLAVIEACVNDLANLAGSTTKEEIKARYQALIDRYDATGSFDGYWIWVNYRPGTIDEAWMRLANEAARELAVPGSDIFMTSIAAADNYVGGAGSLYDSNGWVAAGDSYVHPADNTGAIAFVDRGLDIVSSAVAERKVFPLTLWKGLGLV